MGKKNDGDGQRQLNFWADAEFTQKFDRSVIIIVISTIEHFRMMWFNFKMSPDTNINNFRANGRTHFMPLLEACQTSYDVFRLLRTVCLEFNFLNFSAIKMPSNYDSKLSALSVVSNWPPELVRAYDELDLFRNSPVIKRLQESTEPLVWSLEDINRNRAQNERNSAVELFREFGLENGVYFSVHTASGEIGAVSFAGNRPSPELGELMELQYLANSFYNRLVDFQNAAETKGAKLSPRELDCLRLTAAGKTSIEIAKKLVISEHTVNHYLSTICQKLEAQNRAHAVSSAIRMGLLD